MGFTKRVTKSVKQYVKYIKFFCPFCGRKTRIAEAKEPFGKKKLCKGCGHTFELSEKYIESPWGSETTRIIEPHNIPESKAEETPAAPSENSKSEQDVVELESCLAAKSPAQKTKTEDGSERPESAYEKNSSLPPLERVGFLWRFLANILDNVILGVVMGVLWFFLLRPVV